MVYVQEASRVFDGSFWYLRKNKDVPENPLEDLSLAEWKTEEEEDNEDEYVELERLE